MTGGLWGGVFLHLGLSFPTGRLRDPARPRARDRGLRRSSRSRSCPALLFAGPDELGCTDCPENLLLIRPRRRPGGRPHRLRRAALLRAVRRRAARARSSAGAAPSPFERLQLTPVYVCSLLTFLLVTVARAGAGDAAWWAAFIATGLMPFAFLGGLLRSHVSHLDAELHERMEELRASRARLVEAGDAARRRLERDLHDGAQSRLVALALLLRTARGRARRRRRARGRCSTRPRRSCARASPSCASSRAASTRPC